MKSLSARKGLQNEFDGGEGGAREDKGGGRRGSGVGVGRSMRRLFCTEQIEDAYLLV
jgi:hypothetical protein